MKKLGALLLGLTMALGCVTAQASEKPQQQYQMEQLGINSNCYQPVVFYMVSQDNAVGQGVVANMVIALARDNIAITESNAEETVRQFADVCLINPTKSFKEVAGIYARSHK